MIQPLLEAKAKRSTKFRCFFGIWKNLVSCIRYLLTFSMNRFYFVCYRYICLRPRSGGDWALSLNNITLTITFPVKGYKITLLGSYYLLYWQLDITFFSPCASEVFCNEISEKYVYLSLIEFLHSEKQISKMILEEWVPLNYLFKILMVSSANLKTSKVKSY